MDYIEGVHKQNFERIRLSGIKEGDVLLDKKTLLSCKVISIHPLYGWLITDPHMVNQNMDNLCDFMIIDSIKTLEDGKQEAFCRFGSFYQAWWKLTKVSL